MDLDPVRPRHRRRPSRKGAPPLMETKINEVADGIYRLSTYTDQIPGGFVFNQYLLDADEPTGTLLCGDLFTRTGDAGVTSDADPVGPAAAAEDMFKATSLTGATGPTIRSLAELRPERLALMHGPVFTGDTAAALNALAD